MITAQQRLRNVDWRNRFVMGLECDIIVGGIGICGDLHIDSFMLNCF